MQLQNKFKIDLNNFLTDIQVDKQKSEINCPYIIGTSTKYSEKTNPQS